jgi:hypothetical protein
MNEKRKSFEKMKRTNKYSGNHDAGAECNEEPGVRWKELVEHEADEEDCDDGKQQPVLRATIGIVMWQLV